MSVSSFAGKKVFKGQIFFFLGKKAYFFIIYNKDKQRYLPGNDRLFLRVYALRGAFSLILMKFFYFFLLCNNLVGAQYDRRMKGKFLSRESADLIDTLLTVGKTEKKAKL